MAIIRFKKSPTKYTCDFFSYSQHVVSLTFDGEMPDEYVLTSGFNALTENLLVCGDYQRYTTIYSMESDNCVMLSNDESVYVPPVAQTGVYAAINWDDENDRDGIRPESVQVFIHTLDYVELSASNNWTYSQAHNKYEDDGSEIDYYVSNVEIPGYETTLNGKTIVAKHEHVLTLDETKELKVEELNATQQATIVSGVDVILSDGTTEHFSLKDQDQISLIGLQTMVMAGAESIPWHIADESVACRYYSNADMAKITTTALAYVSYQVTLFRDMRIYVRSLETIDEVNAVKYGIEYLPEENRSDVLNNLLEQMEAEQTK